MKKIGYLLFLSVVLLLSSCSGSESNGEKLDYEQTKKMIVDILKTDEGKKAIKEILADQEIIQEVVMDQAIIKETIQKNLNSEKGAKFWKKSFEDPKFAESVAKSMKKEHETLIKELMKDPEYQGMMIDILKDPSLKADIAESLKSKEFREHLREVVTETIESPLYKVKIQEILLKAAEEMESGKKEEDKQDGSQQGGNNGGSSSS
ncbi:spore germination lipoprotein GerD [Lederbergia lenta]|uniref:Spore germination protein GerD n=1 Tax=Lederbergia lenta TaxID=1467 RepID=A0A2X4VGP6_LEDLE|nr:spore germination lipoprotein GerD [Lederbergia lenta]MCM3113251.1 spore germination lipoprotein GerD [Lederbergia lenta]MEC2326406.1 spore germination lipoprotein GerD [Lederbergia lenta]SQI51417.1 spore germination protein GerD [Lederbergia lenta]